MPDKPASPEIRACKAIVKTLFSSALKKDAWIFYEPVDAYLLGLTDYYDIVKEPMDLSTVRHSLNTGVYQTCTEFAKDMRLIFYNTYLYTNPGHLCYEMAKKLQLFFEDLYAEVHRTYAPNSDVTSESGDYSSSSALTPFGEDAGPADWSPPGSYSAEVVGTPFTTEEDFDLHAKIQQLDGEVLLHVIHLVQRMEGAALGNMELEFDVRQLKVQTKRSIQEYMASKGITGKRVTRNKPKYN